MHIAEKIQNVVDAPNPFNIGRENIAMTKLVANMTKIDKLVALALALKGAISEIIKKPNMPGLIAYMMM